MSAVHASLIVLHVDGCRRRTGRSASPSRQERTSPKQPCFSQRFPQAPRLHRSTIACPAEPTGAQAKEQFPSANPLSGSKQSKKSRSRVRPDSSQQHGSARPGRPSPRPRPGPAHRYAPVPAWPVHALALCGQRLVGRPRRKHAPSGPMLLSQGLAQPAVPGCVRAEGNEAPASAFHRPPTSQPSTHRVCAPPAARVGGVLASQSGAQNCSILCGHAGVRLHPVAQACGAVDDQVEDVEVVGGDAWRGVDEPLWGWLGHHVSLMQALYGVACKFASSSGGLSADMRVRGLVERISAAAAPSFRGVPATARREREWKPEPATQRDLHCQKRQQHVVAEEKLPRTRRRVLPPMPPFTGARRSLHTIRSHSGSLPLPRCNHFLGNPLTGWQLFYIQRVPMERDPCGPSQSFLVTGNDCGMSQSFSPLPPFAIIS